jgi:hypothetical protein
MIGYVLYEGEITTYEDRYTHASTHCKLGAAFLLKKAKEKAGIKLRSIC